MLWPNVACTTHVRMGTSMRRSSCRAHMMLPATGGASRGSGGACLCRSYSFWICTRQRAADHLRYT